MAGKRAAINIDVIADASKAKAGLQQAEQAAGSLQNQFKNVAKTASAAFATREIVNFAKGAIGAASDLSESMNAVAVTFGDASDGIMQLGESAAKAVGMSQKDFNAFAVQFAGFTKQVAGASGDVVAVTDQLTVRIADFASVMNLDIPRAAQIFQSSLAGSTEPIRAFGIDMSAAAVAAFAVENGMVESAAAMTEADKVAARYALLMEETAQMSGDFANTSDGLANSQRILADEMENAKATIGEAMVPALQGVMGAVKPVLEAFTALPAGLQQTIALVGLGAVGFKSASTTLQGFGLAAKTANTAVGALTVGIGVAIVAFNEYSTAKAEVKAAADRVKQALDAETGTVTDNTAAVIEQQLKTGELGDAMEMLGLDTELATQAIMGNTDAQDRFITSMRDAREANVGLGDGLRSLFDGQMLAIDAARIVQREYQGMVQGFEAAERQADRLSDSQERVAQQSTYVADATEELRIINQLGGEATKEFTRLTNKYEESLSDVYMTTNLLIPEIQKLLDIFDMRDTMDRARNAVSEYNEMLKSTTASSQELEQAQRDAARLIFATLELLGRIPASVQTDFKILVDEGNLDAALAKLDRLAAAREAVAEVVAGTTTTTYVPQPERELEAIATGGNIGLVASTPIGALPASLPTVVSTQPVRTQPAAKPATNVNIQVNTGVGDPGSIGQAIVENIKAYERRAGRFL